MPALSTQPLPFRLAFLGFLPAVVVVGMGADPEARPQGPQGRRGSDLEAGGGSRAVRRATHAQRLRAKHGRANAERLYVGHG